MRSEQRCLEEWVTSVGNTEGKERALGRRFSVLFSGGRCARSEVNQGSRRRWEQKRGLSGSGHGKTHSHGNPRSRKHSITRHVATQLWSLKGTRASVGHHWFQIWGKKWAFCPSRKQGGFQRWQLLFFSLSVMPGSLDPVARQAPPSMWFSWQEYWSGLPFPFPGGLPKPRDWTLNLLHCR